MANTRPLSPHLGIYRWRVNMIQSTLHRLTGLFLCAGTLMFTWGLIAVAAGGAAWGTFAWFSGTWIGMILWFLWTWSLLFHLCNGIEHLFHDGALGYGPPRRDRTLPPSYWKTGWLVIALSIALTVLVWVLLMLSVGAGGVA